MQLLRRAGLLFALAFAATLAMAQSQSNPQPAPLNLQPQAPPPATVGRPYSFILKTSGGTQPLQWNLSGQLPPGVTFKDGVISGKPKSTGDFPFTVTVRDNTGASIRRDLVLPVIGLLNVKWVQVPGLNGKTLSGSVQVSNDSSDRFDLTVIIVAVNEIGKAFALGYQHFNLAQNLEQKIPFSSDLPNGTYVVHADAVAEIPQHETILRQHLQTLSPLQVDVNR